MSGSIFFQVVVLDNQDPLMLGRVRATLVIDNYQDIVKGGHLRNLYKENTNVLSYYVIKCVLMNNYQGFLAWCKSNNFSLLQFKKTISSQKEYCKFIERNYKTRAMLKGVSETSVFLHSLERKSKRSNYHYIMSNLRMSICEMG